MKYTKEFQDILRDRTRKSGNEMFAAIGKDNSILFEKEGETSLQRGPYVQLNHAEVLAQDKADGAVHTHIDSVSFSNGDLITFGRSNLKWAEVLLPNGEVHRVEKTIRLPKDAFVYQLIDLTISDIYVDRMKDRLSEINEEANSRRLDAVCEVARMFEWKFSIRRLHSERKGDNHDTRNSTQSKSEGA
jgi:hypothetical protein